METLDNIWAIINSQALASSLAWLAIIISTFPYVRRYCKPFNISIKIDKEYPVNKQHYQAYLMARGNIEQDILFDKTCLIINGKEVSILGVYDMYDTRTGEDKSAADFGTWRIHLGETEKRLIRFPKIYYDEGKDDILIKINYRYSNKERVKTCRLPL